ncbi:hypothetical protein P3342_000903 [Pyrenophora teres f. teres]|nr:hypothetical protein P3342_000903 [Pyrenophora teres f. teres]
MKDIFAFAGFVAFATAADPRPNPKLSILVHSLARRNYAATYYSVPLVPTDSYQVSSSVVDIPVPQSSDCLDTEPCSTVLVTITVRVGPCDRDRGEQRRSAAGINYWHDNRYSD